jgi:hypothetical protein
LKTLITSEKITPSMKVATGWWWVDDISLEVEMGLDELLVKYVQVVHESVVVGIDDQLHLLQAWRSGPGPGR